MNYLHFHRGSTCHGCPTLKEALREALELAEDVDIVERKRDHIGRCYSTLRLSKDLGYPRGNVRGRIVTRIRWQPTITGRRK